MKHIDKKRFSSSLLFILSLTDIFISEFVQPCTHTHFLIISFIWNNIYNLIISFFFVLSVSLVPMVSCACNEMTVQEANSTCNVDRNLMNDALEGDEGDYPMVCS